jgi:fatty-acyl-CoA synthase
MSMQRLGATVVVMEHFDAAEFLALVERHRVTHTQLVPTMFVRLLRLSDEERRRHDLSSLRFAVHAAAPCPVPVKRQMLDWWGPIIHEYYAGTEDIGSTTITPEEWLAHPGSVGRPIDEIHILDDDGTELPPGEPGAVYPAQETGNVLASHAAVADVAVIGVPDEEMGEAVKAVVQPADGVPPGDDLATELLAHCRAELATYKCPRSVDFVDELPRDPNGKLYKRLLRERYWRGHMSRVI